MAGSASFDARRFVPGAPIFPRAALVEAPREEDEEAEEADAEDDRTALAP